MRKSASIVAAFGLVALGYLIGSANLLAPGDLWAQDAPAANPVSEDTLEKITAARQALEAAQEALIADQRLVSATKGLNPIAVLAGGIDAPRDLEIGLGVDPGTFAALYAGLATDEIEEKLGKDAEGRLTYNKRVIQMYPISGIRKLYRKAAVVADNDE